MVSAYLGLTAIEISAVNDKFLHFIDFFLLTVSSLDRGVLTVALTDDGQTCFYWILETSRRRSLNFTLLVCTAILGLGSEVVQGALPVRRPSECYVHFSISLLRTFLAEWPAV